MEKQKQGNGNGNGKLTLTRRDFLKTTAAAGAGGGLLTLSTAFDNALAVPATGTVARSVRTTCPFCSVGCGQVVELDAFDNIIEVRGDPDHIVSNGALCPKGAATVQFVNGDRRIGTSVSPVKTALNASIVNPAYRVSNGAWKELSWDDAIHMVATRLKNARDTHSVTSGGAAGAGWTSGTYLKGQQSKSIAFLGCSHATNEENWVYRKLIANLGTNNTEHQARI